MGDDVSGVLDAIRRRDLRTGVTETGDAMIALRFRFKNPFSGEEKLLLTFLSAFVAFVAINLSASDRSTGNTGYTSNLFSSISVSDKEEAVVPIGRNSIQVTMMQNENVK